MNIGIIGAIDQEIKTFKTIINYKEIQNIGQFQIYIGTFKKNNIFLIKSGIGKVSASIASMILIKFFKPDIIINSGSAGSLHSQLKIGDIIIPNYLCYYDVNLTNFGYSRGQIPQYPKKFKINKNLYNIFISTAKNFKFQFMTGLLITGDSFVSEKKIIKKLKVQFSSAIGVEMESTAIAQVCYQFHIPLIVIKSVSDLSDETATLNFKKNISIASLKSSNLVKLVLENNNCTNLLNK
ncbi:5'-methylthioadenosine/adenosylhomocysteine nucleosidase [Buchnera aphidicola (Aphis helianthi)]|uniref:adenosylhomocysteine nucleosidase n=1 Tax=Buchnera aphidicola (Aphis helianthi) TaxID=2315802 RepID=A0A4D6XPK6_9GAMM|nr:5'-methylthioadenosine/adenosylhomocysteine nucleosidase [Buchnera aphidicola]QCI17409.1 5'-methylthioadenosine/adenosylhomocysteine nucleosidase [Buchnera aphidicola (Aphis helianthi)]